MLQGEAAIKEELEAIKLEMEAARRRGDLGKVAEIQYSKVPALEKRLLEAQARKLIEQTFANVRQQLTPSTPPSR